MPAFTESTPRLARKVKTVPITIPAIFAEGVTLTGPTVAWANNALASQIVNSVGGAISEWLESANKDLKKGEAPRTAADFPDLQAFVDKLFSDRTLGVNARKGTGTGGGSDPLASLIRTIATTDAKARIVKAGYTVKAFMDTKTTGADGKPSTKYSDFIDHRIAVDGEAYKAQAEAILAAQSADIADEGDGEFFTEVQAAA